MLQLFVSEPDEERFGLELIKLAGLRSGSLYPILHRFEEHRLLVSRWENLEEAVRANPPRRPRRKYRLDPRNAETAAQMLAEWASHQRGTRQPSLRPEAAAR